MSVGTQTIHLTLLYLRTKMHAQMGTGTSCDVFLTWSVIYGFCAGRNERQQKEWAIRECIFMRNYIKNKYWMINLHSDLIIFMTAWKSHVKFSFNRQFEWTQLLNRLCITTNKSEALGYGIKEWVKVNNKLNIGFHRLIYSLKWYEKALCECDSFLVPFKINI